jgi:hypothetical protein
VFSIALLLPHQQQQKQRPVRSTKPSPNGSLHVREYAARHGMSEEQAIEAGLADKAREFKDGGAELYR